MRFGSISAALTARLETVPVFSPEMRGLRPVSWDAPRCESLLRAEYPCCLPHQVAADGISPGTRSSSGLSPRPCQKLRDALKVLPIFFTMIQNKG